MKGRERVDRFFFGKEKEIGGEFFRKSIRRKNSEK